MLLAEELLLLLIDENGRVDHWLAEAIDVGFSSAVIAELLMLDAVEVSESRRFLKSSKIRIKHAIQSDELVLADALRLIAEKERRTASIISRLRKGLRGRLFLRLEQRGIVRHRAERYGVVRTRSTWPVVDSSERNALRAPIAKALFAEGELTERQAVLLRLLVETANVHVAFPAGRANESFPRRAFKNVQLLTDARAMTDRPWTPPALTHLFRACSAAVPVPD